MKLELELHLIKAYPSLYAGVGKPITESLMSFGFECQDGWFDILDKLSRALTDLNEDVVATQVKEKYGTLHFYIAGGSDRADELIDTAEDESAKTCEVCGKPGKIREACRWLQALCSEHYVEWALRKLEV